MDTRPVLFYVKVATIILIKDKDRTGLINLLKDLDQVRGRIVGKVDELDKEVK